MVSHDAVMLLGPSKVNAREILLCFILGQCVAMCPRLAFTVTMTHFKLVVILLPQLLSVIVTDVDHHTWLQGIFTGPK